MPSNLILYICPLEDQVHLITGTCYDPDEILILHRIYSFAFRKVLMIVAEKSLIELMECSLLHATASDKIEDCSFTGLPNSITVKTDFANIHALPIIEKIVRHFDEIYPNKITAFMMIECHKPEGMSWKSEKVTIDSLPWSQELGTSIIKSIE